MNDESNNKSMSVRDVMRLLAERDEVRQRVRNAVEQLPERFRRAIVLRYESGLSSNEIAAILRVAPATVNVWIFRGSKILRASLGDLAP